MSELNTAILGPYPSRVKLLNNIPEGWVTIDTPWFEQSRIESSYNSEDWYVTIEKVTPNKERQSPDVVAQEHQLE